MLSLTIPWVLLPYLGDSSLGPEASGPLWQKKPPSVLYSEAVPFAMTPQANPMPGPGSSFPRGLWCLGGPTTSGSGWH